MRSVTPDSHTAYTWGAWTLSVHATDGGLFAWQGGFCLRMAEHSVGWLDVYDGGDEVTTLGNTPRGARTVKHATHGVMAAARASAASRPRHAALGHVGDSLKFGVWTLTHARDGKVVATAESSADYKYILEPRVPGCEFYFKGDLAVTFTLCGLSAAAARAAASMRGHAVAVVADASHVYTWGGWCFAVKDALYAWQRSFAFSVKATSNGWVAVYDGKRELIEYSYDTLGNVTVAPAAHPAFAHVHDEARYLPRRPVLVNAEQELCFGTWTLSLASESAGQLVPASHPKDVYVIEARVPALQHRSRGELVSTIRGAAAAGGSDGEATTPRAVKAAPRRVDADERSAYTWANWTFVSCPAMGCMFALTADGLAWALPEEGTGWVEVFDGGAKHVEKGAGALGAIGVHAATHTDVAHAREAARSRPRKSVLHVRGDTLVYAGWTLWACADDYAAAAPARSAAAHVYLLPSHASSLLHFSRHARLSAVVLEPHMPLTDAAAAAEADRAREAASAALQRMEQELSTTAAAVVAAPASASAVPPDVAEWLARLSLEPFGAKLCGELGVETLDDVADVFDVQLQHIAMGPEERQHFLREARKLRRARTSVVDERDHHAS